MVHLDVKGPKDHLVFLERWGLKVLKDLLVLPVHRDPRVTPVRRAILARRVMLGPLGLVHLESKARRVSRVAWEFLVNQDTMGSQGPRVSRVHLANLFRDHLDLEALKANRVHKVHRAPTNRRLERGLLAPLDQKVQED